MIIVCLATSTLLKLSQKDESLVSAYYNMMKKWLFCSQKRDRFLLKRLRKVNSSLIRSEFSITSGTKFYFLEFFKILKCF